MGTKWGEGVTPKWNFREVDSIESALAIVRSEQQPIFIRISGKAYRIECSGEAKRLPHQDFDGGSCAV
jgi:hypothetical protein